MNNSLQDKVTQWYLDILAKDRRKSGLLLRVLDCMIEGRGSKYEALVRLFDDVDEVAIVRAASLRMAQAGVSEADPLADAISRICS